MATIEVGTIIAGKYRVERQLSQGGMGSLWVARQLQLQRLVAIKLMEPSLAASAQGRSRFEREAQAAALIQSPNVVQIHDYGVERDTPYIVMELLSGEDLGRRLKRERRLPLPALATYFGQITKALRKAHEAGMVHLDLKPANIFLARDDDDEIVKVLDFGIAKMIIPGDATEATATGVVLGSVHYMSPEQARGRRGLDHRSDLWSLGVIAFRAITGELPFGGSQVGDVLVKVCADPIPRASSVLPGLAPEVDAFLLRALDRDPEARFQSARELTAALTQLAWPGDPRAPQLSIAGDVARAEAPRAGPAPVVARPPAAPMYPPPATTPDAPHAATAQWPAPAEAGTLTTSPGVSDLVLREPLAPAKRGFPVAVLGAIGIVSVLAAVLIGSFAVLIRPARTTVSAAVIPPAAAPPDEPPPPPSPVVAATAREIEVEAPPEPEPAPPPAVKVASSAQPKPASPPIVAAASKPRSPPPAPKKPNPALGF
jgi:serine/threonine-protein kinase